MRKIFTLVSAVALALGMHAATLDTIQVDGLYYQINAEDSIATLIRYSASSKYEIDNIVIPVDVVKDEISYPVVALGQGALRNTTASTITFAEGSQVKELGTQCFQAAVNVQELELPEGIRLIPLTGIHNATATNPMQMKKLVLPATTDSLALFSICLPQLKTLEFKGAVPPRIATKVTATWTQNPWQISTTNVCNTNPNAVVIVPDGALEAYQNTAWIGDYFTTIVEKSNYVEVENIAAFNAVEDGKTVKLLLNDAKVTAYNDLQGVYYVEDATAATVIAGTELTASTALNGYLIGTKSIEDVDFMNDPSLAYEHKLSVIDASAVTATETTLIPTTMTISEACVQANYAKYITIEDVTVSGGNRKTLTDSEGRTIKTYNYLGGLPEDYTWPTKIAKISGICLYYMTGWFIFPISVEDIVAKDTTPVENVETENNKAVKFIENGQLVIMYNGTKYNVHGEIMK